MSKIDVSSPNYVAALKLANIVLTNNGLAPITNLLEFRGIERELFLKTEINEAFDQIKDEFYTCYNKSKTGYYRKDVISWSFVAFKNAIKQLGFDFKVVKKPSSRMIGTRKSFYTGYYYTVTE